MLQLFLQGLSDKSGQTLWLSQFFLVQAIPLKNLQEIVSTFVFKVVKFRDPSSIGSWDMCNLPKPLKSISADYYITFVANFPEFKLKKCYKMSVKIVLSPHIWYHWKHQSLRNTAKVKSVHFSRGIFPKYAVFHEKCNTEWTGFENILKKWNRNNKN